MQNSATEVMILCNRKDHACVELQQEGSLRKNPFGYHCSALVPAKFLGLVCPSRLLTAKVGHTRHRLLCAAIHKKGPKNGYNSVYGCSGCRAGGKRQWPRRPQRPKAESLLPCEKSNIIE